MGNGGIVDQNVDPAEGGQYIGGDPLAACRVAKVAKRDDDARTSAQFLNLPQRRIERGAFATRNDGNTAARAQKAKHHGAAKAAASAGDDDTAPRERRMGWHGFRFEQTRAA